MTASHGMTGASALVGEIDDVRRRTRRASFGGAVPLALLGLLVMAAAPFYAWSYASNATASGPDGTYALVMPARRPEWLLRLTSFQSTFTNDDTPIAVYWLVAVPVAFLAIAGYHAWRARRTGLSLNGWRVAAVGVAVFAALVVSMAFSPRLSLLTMADVRPTTFLNPLLVVAIGVFAIAWVERSRAVLAAGLAFLAGVLVADVRVYANYGTETAWDNIQSWGTATLLLGGWLLAAAAALALARARTARS